MNLRLPTLARDQGGQIPQSQTRRGNGSVVVVGLFNQIVDRPAKVAASQAIEASNLIRIFRVRLRRLIAPAHKRVFPIPTLRPIAERALKIRVPIGRRPPVRCL